VNETSAELSVRDIKEKISEALVNKYGQTEVSEPILI